MHLLNVIQIVFGLIYIYVAKTCFKEEKSDYNKTWSPLGSFSPSNTATVLLFDEADETEADKADKDDDEEAAVAVAVEILL